jgi:hypothetical protein
LAKFSTSAVTYPRMFAVGRVANAVWTKAEPVGINVMGY